MGRRRRSLLRRSFPWLLALGLVAGVAHRLHLALALSSTDIVDTARVARLGDPDNDVPKDPQSALQVLSPLLERDPEHYGGLMEAARCWGDLRNYDVAVTLLERAARVAPGEAQAVASMRTAVHFLIRDDRYDEAIEVAERVCALQPDNLLLPLQHAAALYSASVSTQEDLQRPFMAMDNGLAELAVQDRIEAFVTDLWGEPEVEPIIEQLASDADLGFQAQLREDLLYARRRFLEASAAFEAYETFDGFDGGVAQEYTALLLRSGRLFDAYVEAALALRQPGVQLSLAQNLHTVQADCAAVMQEWGLAAEHHQQTVDKWVAKSNWCPPRYLNALLEMRVKAEHWDWILENDRLMRRLLGDDPYPDYALAAALLATDRVAEAEKAILTPFTIVGSGTSMPSSVRGEPYRKWDVLRLAVDVYAAAGDDQRTLTALDRLLSHFPGDLDARRRRVAVHEARGSLESATDDAFRLLVAERRDAADFALWLRLAEQLSIKRHGATLEQRASERLVAQSSLLESSLDASFESAQVARRRGLRDGPPGMAQAAASFPTQDPALGFAVVRERVRRNDLVRARNDARHLLQAHPQVQQFRYDLARLLVREGKLTSAASDFQRLLEEVPSDSKALDHALRIEQALGHEAEAARLVNTRILSDPTGVGAVQYAQLLLDRGLPERAEKLLIRVIASSGEDPSPDVLLMLARAKIAHGQLTSATGILNALRAAYPHMEEVAIVGLELGLAEEKEGVIHAAGNILAPQSAGLFPDEMKLVCRRLLDAELYEELRAIFPAATWELPAVRPALRSLAAASKALGEIDDTDRLLSLVGDHAAIRDTTLLLVLDVRPEEASRRLRLLPAPPERAPEIEFCLMVASAFGGSRVLYDDIPTARLRELGVVEGLTPRELELLDFTLRASPSLKRLDTILPQEVVDEPTVAYPHAGLDVSKLVELARKDPIAARRACQALMALLVAGDRELWTREVRHLCDLAVAHAPGLSVPSVRLGRWYLEQGDPLTALELQSGMLVTGDLDPQGLSLFIEASDVHGKPEWGLALALGLVPTHGHVRLSLAEALAAQGHVQEALKIYDEWLELVPHDSDGLAGVIEVLGTLRLQRQLVSRVEEVLEHHATSSQLLGVSADALAGLPGPDEATLAVMERVEAQLGDHLRLQVALARSRADDAELLGAHLERALALVRERPVDRDTEEAARRVRSLADATRLARAGGFPDLARELADQALQLEPGNLRLFGELAQLELDAGHLQQARTYLEVMTFVDRTDKEPPLTLGKLLSEQMGQPHLGATVIRDAYPTAKPPAAVVILAAETFLRGNSTGALALFQELRDSPLITVDGILEVAMMALAGEHDDVAMVMFDHFLSNADREHPFRPRAAALQALISGTPRPQVPTRPTRGGGGAGRPADGAGPGAVAGGDADTVDGDAADDAGGAHTTTGQVDAGEAGDPGPTDVPEPAPQAARRPAGTEVRGDAADSDGPPDGANGSTPALVGVPAAGSADEALAVIDDG